MATEGPTLLGRLRVEPGRPLLLFLSMLIIFFLSLADWSLRLLRSSCRLTRRAGFGGRVSWRVARRCSFRCGFGGRVSWRVARRCSLRCGFVGRVSWRVVRRCSIRSGLGPSREDCRTSLRWIALSSGRSDARPRERLCLPNLFPLLLFEDF